MSFDPQFPSLSTELVHTATLALRTTNDADGPAWSGTTSTISCLISGSTQRRVDKNGEMVRYDYQVLVASGVTITKGAKLTNGTLKDGSTVVMASAIVDGIRPLIHPQHGQVGLALDCIKSAV